MKILYFGVFERPFDTEVYVSKTLQSLGHEVIQVESTKVTLEEAKRIVPTVDFVLFSKGWFVPENEFNEYFATCGVLRVGWFWDLAWGTGREWQIYRHPIFKCDMVFTSDGGHEEDWKKIGVNHKVLRQGIFEPEAYMAKPTQKDYDTIFVGSSVHAAEFKWDHRQQLIDWMKDTYFRRFGWYGKTDGVRNGALNQLFANTKVVIGDSVASPHYWSNRIYETLGRGGFLIFPMVEGLDKEFTPYKDFIPYKPGEWKKLKEKIDYYLEHDKEREAIRLHGFNTCRKKHTYTVRCKQLIEYVNEYKKLHP